MPQPTKLLPLLPLFLALAACASAPISAPQSRPLSARHPVRVPQHLAHPPAQLLAMPGLEGVIGADQSELARQFGPARLDVWEGDARKLQFTGAACVLDVYLYPAARASEPRATYVDARRPSDGQDVDRASCVAALRQRR